MNNTLNHKNTRRNTENGISMMEIVVAIIILILIAFFAIYNSQNAVPQAKATELYREMKSMGEAVEFIKSNINIKEDYPLGDFYDAEWEAEDWYIVYGTLNPDTTTIRKAAKNLGLDNLKRDYVVNYKLGDFRLKDAVDVQGNQITTFAEINSLINSGLN